MANQLMRAPSNDRVIAPSDPTERMRFWVERGNRILWGMEPTSTGEFLSPRHDLEWVCRNGAYSIEPRQQIRIERAA